MNDATYEDGQERPITVTGIDAEDLTVISALVQDAVLPITEMTYDRKARSFGLLLNRFRWEEHGADRQRQSHERVQSLLVLRDVETVQSNGLDFSDQDIVLSLLSLSFEPGADGAGQITLVFAGDGAVALTVECINVTLKDVSKPYVAPSRKAPQHPEGF
jgi:hypothetical protein